jgi:uncharacterized membrane protein YgaE (UPF0421/DUF939 family)
VAVISVGATIAGRARRTVEIVIGVALGVGLATLLVAAFGQSAVLLALVVTGAMLLAGATRGGELLAVQAGIAAVLVFGAEAHSAGAALTRMGGALVGGASAALVSLFVLPPDPVRLLSDRARAVLAELESVLVDIAHALGGSDPSRAASALERARAADGLVEALNDARPAAGEIARLVPLRRRMLGEVRRLDEAATHVDHAARHVRVLARASVGAVLADPRAAAEYAEICAALGAATHRLNLAWKTGDGEDVARRDIARVRAKLEALQLGRRDAAAMPVVAAARGVADDLALAADAR